MGQTEREKLTASIKYFLEDIQASLNVTREGSQQKPTQMLHQTLNNGFKKSKSHNLTII